MVLKGFLSKRWTDWLLWQLIDLWHFISFHYFPRRQISAPNISLWFNMLGYTHSQSSYSKYKRNTYIYTSLLYFNKLMWILVDIGNYELALLPIWSRHQSRDHLVSFLFCYNVTLIISNCIYIVLLIRHATTKSWSGFRGVSY